MSKTLAKPLEENPPTRGEKKTRTTSCENAANQAAAHLEQLRQTAPRSTEALDAAKNILQRDISRRHFIAGSVAVTGAAALASVPRTLAQETPAADILPEIAEVNLNVNGRSYALQLDTRTSLLDTLRETLGLTGSKKGCNQGTCGACTVHIDGQRVLSCLTLAVTVPELPITTIEGLARGGNLHPLQLAFIEHDAFQCGFCTSGQIMSGVACIAEGHAGSEAEIREWMSGNLCRCSAYPGIVAAVQDAAGRS